MIRPISSSDFDSLVAIGSIPAVMKYIGSGNTWTSKNVENFLNFIRDNTLHEYFVIEDPYFVGFGGIHPNRFANKDPLLQNKRFITIAIYPEHQGKGYGKKMIQHIIDYISPEPAYVSIDKDNIRSMSMFVKKFHARFESYISFTKLPIFRIDTFEQYTYNFTCERAHKYGALFSKILKVNPLWIHTVDNPIFSDMNTKSKIKFYIDGDDIITLKHKLHTIVNKEKYYPFTIIVHTKEDIINSDINISVNWYLKPSDALVGAGKDIHYIQGGTFHIPNLDAYKTWVLQREVTNRKDIDGKYYITRAYTVIIHTITTCYVFINKIAKQIRHDKDDPISHQSTDKRTTDISDGEKHICKVVMEKVMNKLIPSGHVGFNVYGFDLITQQDENVMLLEVNDHAQLNVSDNYALVMLNDVVKILELFIGNESSIDSIKLNSLELVNTFNFLNIQTKFIMHYKK